jgi:predicted nuclease of predicted toxin-antitoxin system
MNFIIDTHLPNSICEKLNNLGFKALHTEGLKDGNSTSDETINELAIELGACVITKDSDFYQSFLLKRVPPKLVMVQVGNMRLKNLKSLFDKTLPQIIEVLYSHDLVELHSDKIIGID